MTVYRSLAEAPVDFGPSALTIGNFDGVHFGHRRILKRLASLGRAHGWKPSVLTFDPHPARVVAPNRAPRLMTSPERRAELMREEGIAQILILPFTPELAHLSPEDFVRQLLVERLDARVVLVGDNFRFGYRQSGNVRVLAELGRRFGFATEVVPAVSWRGRIVSSSGIRALLDSGSVSVAARLLQRPYAIEGVVVGGRGVGSRQTVPTLNLATAAEVIPARGVYITRVGDLDGPRSWNAVTNIGYRPTFEASGQVSIESFLFDTQLDTPPRRIRIEFLRRLREERKFESPEALKAQILRDVRAARKYFRRVATWRVQCP